MEPAFTPRPAQARILAYTGGHMGISAVPGSGKTFTLSLLAARLVERLATPNPTSAGALAGESAPLRRLDDHEVLVVTFTNSAVANFRARIGSFLQVEKGLLPGVGYRVRTLHGLAHDIVRERPGLVGLSEDFDIVDERTASEIKREAVVSYLNSHALAFAPYWKPEFIQNPSRIARPLQVDAVEIANTVIRVAKEINAQPHLLARQLERQSGTWPLLEFGLHIYADYQRSLKLRGAVDFDDLILLAIEALEADAGYLQRLQSRWPFVLEDEAQDSSAAQQKLLGLLTAGHGNWVRVGDPNQAINTTFTSAKARFLREFLDRHPEQARDLPDSGRSARPIIALANTLIDWSRTDDAQLPATLALDLPYIQPTPPGDPQPNPEPGSPPAYVHTIALTPDRETEMVLRSLQQRWLPNAGTTTCAVLALDNSRGFDLVTALEQANVPYDDSLLRTDNSTRATAQALATVVGFIALPQAPGGLAELWSEVWYPRCGRRQGAEGGAVGRKAPLPEPVLIFARALGKLREPERFIFPDARDWLTEIEWLDDAAGMRELVTSFRADLQRWSKAAILPVDELVLTVGNDLFVEPMELALAHRLALLLAKLAGENQAWRLPELAVELKNIAENKRRILGFGEDAQGYAPQPGVVTVATMHGAKGLEWDRVYLMGANTWCFPSGADQDPYRAERWYVRDRLNLVAEVEAQLRQLRMGTVDDYREGDATAAARLDLAAERLRLLYVGITRARRELIITYNTGRESNQTPLGPARAVVALAEYLRARN